MEEQDDQMTLDTASRICRQVELTDAYIKALDSSKSEEHVHYADRQQHRGRGGYGNGKPQYNQGWTKGRGDACDRCYR